MSMIQIGIIGIVGTILAIQLSKTHKEYTMVIGIGIAVIIFVQILSRIEVVIDAIYRIQNILNIDASYIQIILKMLGITYIAEFSAGICKDAGHGNIATQIELFGKVAILALSIPILLTLLETIDAMLS